MKQFGIAAVLSFIDKGVKKGFDTISESAKKLKERTDKLKDSLNMIKGGLTRAGTAFLPFSAAIGVSLKKGADFEQAIAQLHSKLLDDFDPTLTQVAKKLGATTVFSATQAANAMTLLAQSGLKTKDIIGAVGGVLDAASAEGISLADATSIVVSNMRAFNLDASEAAGVAGKLALASARTNSTMIELQEGLKFAAVASRSANISMDQTVAVLGALQNIGLKATLAGTAFRNAINHIVKPSKDGTKAINRLGLSLADLRKMIDKGDVVGAFRAISDRLAKMDSPAKRLSATMDIFNIRGAGVGTALDLSGKSLKEFNTLLSDLNNEAGQTAKKMAGIQLDTVTGQFKLLVSAMEGLQIEVFSLVAKQTAGSVRFLADSLGDLVTAMQFVAGRKIMDEKDLAIVNAIPSKIFEVAKGVNTAVTEVMDLFKGVIETVMDVGAAIGLNLGDKTVANMTRLAVKFVALGAVIAPIGFAAVVAANQFIGLGTAAIGAFSLIAKTGIAQAGVMKLIGSVKALRFAIAGAGALGDVATFGMSSIGKAGLVGAAAAAGYGIGMLVDKMLTWLGVTKTMQDWFQKGSDERAKKTVSEQRESVTKTTVGRLANQFVIQSQKEGRDATIRTSMGESVALTRETAQTKLVTFMERQNFTAKQISDALATVQNQLSLLPTATTIGTSPMLRPAQDALVSKGGILPVSSGDVVVNRSSLAGGIISNVKGGLAARVGLGGGDPGRTTPPPASNHNLKVEIPVMINARQIALAVAEIKLQDLERSGVDLKPGDRSALLQRGFQGAY